MKAFISAKNQINVSELLEELRDTIKTLPEDIKAYSYKIFTDKDIQNFIVEKNKQLLEQGLRPDLTPIEKEPEGKQTSNLYERQSIYERSELGLQTKFVDLYRTGFFYESLEVKAGSEELLEFSTDPKSPELERVWGDILGISSEDILELIYLLRPKIITFVNNRLKLKR